MAKRFKEAEKHSKGASVRHKEHVRDLESRDGAGGGSTGERAEPSLRHPSPTELESPLFKEVWKAIKGWDISRTSNGMYAGATGTDVCTILDAVARAALAEGSREEGKSDAD